MKKLIIVLSLAAFLFTFFTACSNSSSSSGGPGTNPETPEKPDDGGDDDGEDDDPKDNFPKEVTFGSWPQTIKADYVTIDESYTITVGAFDCYRGNDGALYVKQTDVNSYTSANNRLHYSDGSEVKGDYAEKYFKVEPLKWDVITTNYNGTGKKLLLCKNVLMMKQFYQYDAYTYGEGNPYNRSDAINRTVDGKTIYANNYEHSEIRAFLNGISYIEKYKEDEPQYTNDKYKDKGFLQTAFTMHERAWIKETNIDNSAESTTDVTGSIEKATDYVCNDTEDKIFLLSLNEVTTSDYGFSAYDQYGENDKRCRIPTDYAKATDLYLSQKTEFTGASWWLRSPYPYKLTSTNSVCMREVAGEGYVDDTWILTNDHIGIVPALCIDELPEPEVHSVNVCKAGDIVFKDGTAIAYKDGLTLSDEQKANVMAYVYYDGGDETLGDRKLGFGFIGPETGAWAHQKSDILDEDSIGLNIKLETNDIHGKENLALIKELEDYSYNYDGNKYPAFRIVDGYNGWYALGYYFNDWYIPSKAEIDKIGSQKDEIFSRLEKLGLQNPFTSGNSGNFWSSSQCKLSSEEASALNIDNPDNFAYAYDFGKGEGHYQYKPWGLYVCVIREF